MSLLESSSYGMVPKNVILMFYRKLYCPKKYLLNIDEHELGVFPRIFLILFEQRFCGNYQTFVRLNFLYTHFQGKIKFLTHLVSLVVLSFYFDLVPLRLEGEETLKYRCICRPPAQKCLT